MVTAVKPPVADVVVMVTILARQVAAVGYVHRSSADIAHPVIGTLLPVVQNVHVRKGGYCRI